MDKNLMSTPHSSLVSTACAGLPSFVARERSTTAPNPTAQGTALSFAGSSAAAAAHPAQVAVLGARVIDLPGLVPRGAPV